MTPALMTSIIVASYATFIMALYAIAKWSVTRVVHQLDSLTQSVQGLTFEVRTIKDGQVTDRQKQTDHEKKIDKEIEMLRTRDHRLLGYLQAMRLQGQVKSGWSFSSDWSMVGMGDKEP